MLRLDEASLAATARVLATTYLCSWDLAQGGADFNALTVLERAPGAGPLAGATYDVTWLERFRDRRTRRLPERTRAIIAQLVLRHRRRLFAASGHDMQLDPEVYVVIDQTGIGPFGLDPFIEAGIDTIGITITGGDAVTHPRPDTYRVPKRDLASAVYNLLEAGRLRVATPLVQRLPEAATLRAELGNFRIKITASGRDKYEAGGGVEWREGEHDDMVLSVACGVWLGETLPAPHLDPMIVAAWGDLPGRVYGR